MPLTEKEVRYQRELCRSAQIKMGCRAEYYLQRGDAAMYNAYSSCADMLRFALNGDQASLEQFDSYALLEEDTWKQPSSEPAYIKQYDDCYDGCGGEDCACCEIYQAHLYDATATPCTGDDDYDIYGRSRVPYEPIEDEDDE